MNQTLLIPVRAAFASGDEVTVTSINPQDCADETRLGQSGKITALITNDCGATEESPLYSVEFNDGESEQYWGEELSPTAQVVAVGECEQFLQYAKLVNDNGDDEEGYIFHPVGLTEGQWNGAAEDLECAWGVFLNDDDGGEFVPPTEDEQYMLGWWGSRTRELVEAFRNGPMPFYACMVGGVVVDALPEGVTPVETHWF